MTCFTFTHTNTLSKYQKALEKFETQFIYHFWEGSFTLSHGREYSAFGHFVGDPSFILVEHDGLLVACLALIKKNVSFGGREYSALYIGDLKIDPAYQMTGLAHELYKYTSRIIETHKDLSKSELTYFVAIQLKHGGDFTSIKHEGSPLELFTDFGSADLFLSPPEALSTIEISELEEEIQESEMLNLSPGNQGPLVDLRGIKDFIYQGKSLQSVHVALGTSCNGTVLEKLKAAGQKALKSYTECCFAIDTRRSRLLEYLQKYTILPKTRIKMYGIENADLKHAWKAFAVGTYEL